MALFSRRLPHVLTPADLGYLLLPTYEREANVGEELAHERLTRALKKQGLVDKIYDAVSAALISVQGTRGEDTLMNAMSKAVPKRRATIKAAPATPALAAMTVWINVEIGVAPEELRAALETEKGQKLLEQGFRNLGKFLVEQLVR